MLSNRFITSAILSLLLIIAALSSSAQTQEDFNKKMAETYNTSLEKTKKVAIAKEMYNMVEKKKELQTLGNYYILKNLFENFTVDEALAKTCAEKTATAKAGRASQSRTNTSAAAGHSANQSADQPTCGATTSTA